MSKQKMKFNKYNIMIYIWIICLNMILVSCSSFKNIENYCEQEDINLKYPMHTNIKNNNTISKKIIQLKTKKLQTMNTVYFPLDQYHILPKFFYILDMHAYFLLNNPLYQIRIEGHADERGTPEYNIALGERRAFSVRKYLQSKGVLLNQMYTISYGKEKPIAFGHTEESYSKNRRVMILYQ